VIFYPICGLLSVYRLPKVLHGLPEALRLICRTRATVIS
jgi:hypothetical protein